MLVELACTSQLLIETGAFMLLLQLHQLTSMAAAAAETALHDHMETALQTVKENNT